MSALVISLVLLSIVSSLIVLVAVVFGIVRQSCDGSRRQTLRARWVGLSQWQRVRLALCALDAFLLLAITPPFVVHSIKGGHDSIWETAFDSAITCFATTAILVLRPASFAVLAGNFHLKRDPSRHRRFRRILPLIALVFVSAISTMSISTGCSSIDPQTSTCNRTERIKIIIVSSQFLFAVLASWMAMVTFRRLGKNAMHCDREPAQRCQSIVATRAPSLSLLIHTQPDPWTRRIDLDLPTTTHPTDFGPTHPVTQVESIDYGPKLAHTILGHTMTSRQTTTATSFGYGSAVASSTNPYHVESSDVVASRDAITVERSTESAVDAAGSMGEEWVGKGYLRVDSPMGDDISRSATHDLLLERKAHGSDRGVETRSLQGMWCAGGLALLWIPMALSTAALISSKGQTYILLASFCLPAWMHLIHLFLACRANLLRRQTPQSNHPRSDTSTPPSASSTTSSPVLVNPTLRPRRPHLRSYSFPLESEPNGYHTLYLANNSKARSVPYLSQHWTAGKIRGDRVVAPRNSFVRGLNLMFHPRPKLEVLSVRGGSSKVGDGGGVRRQGVMSMLEVSGVERCVGTMNSERTRFVQATTSSRELQQSGNQGMTEVVLDMDETPGSPRLPLQPLRDHVELESPTKRPPVQDLSNRTESHSSRSPGFSDDPSITVNSSTSRLFSEILQMVRGPVQSNLSHPNSNQTSSAHHYNLINSSQLSLYVTANESNSLPPQAEVSLSTSLSRAPSSSSTVSLSSISSRIRTSLRRQTSSTSSSPPRIKKMRSRTFASAFGIELNLLKRGSVEGSPSTVSEGGTVGSLMDSPSRIPCGYSPAELGAEGKLHRRQVSRADSTVHLREEVEETLEEVTSCAEESCDSQHQDDAEVEGVDLADMTIFDDVWDRRALDADDEIDSSVVGGEDDLMGFESRRVVARPPFLDTVAEEPEDVDVDERGEGSEQGGGVAKMLREHEMMFPHKTLSRIEEVTEMTTTRSSRFRLDSSGSGGSRRVGNVDGEGATEVRLGLPLSLGCEKGEACAKDRFGSVEEIEDDDVEADESGKSGSERILPFVTPRSTIRRRAAAARLASPTPTRKFFTTSRASSKATPLISPSPRSKTTRLWQLGLDQGIWSSSPPHLPLHNTLDHSFELVSPPTRANLYPNSHSPRRNLRKHTTASPLAKKVLHKASSSKKRRKSRLKGVAVMIARHRFTVVDEDDSLVQQ